MRSADKGVCPQPNTKRSTTATADILASQRTVMKSMRWGEHTPNHYAPRLDADIEPKAIDVTLVMLGRRAAVGPEAASDFLMRPKQKAKTRRRSASQHADLGAVGGLCAQRAAGRHQSNSRYEQLTVSKLRHLSPPAMQSILIARSPYCHQRVRLSSHNTTCWEGIPTDVGCWLNFEQSKSCAKLRAVPQAAVSICSKRHVSPAQICPAESKGFVAPADALKGNAAAARTLRVYPTATLRFRRT